MRILLLLTAAVCFAQPARDSSAISGRVVSAVTGAPLKKAQVSLEPFAPARGVTHEPTVPPVTTDAEGRFTLSGVAAGSYFLVARRNGYLDQGYGAAAPEVVGPPFEVGASETKRDVLLQLTPQSLLYGKVVDEDGDAVVNAQVSVLRVSYAGGQRHLVDAAAGASQDDGSFVVGGLKPGRYFVSAAVRNMDQPQTPERYVPTFYPSAVDPAAAPPVEVAAGAETRGLTIRLRKARVYRIRGRVVMAEHFAAPGGLNLRLFPSTRGVHTQEDGRFEFDGVLPGVYTIESSVFSGRAAVTVSDADLDNVVVRVGPGPEITGKLNGAQRAVVSFTPPGRTPEERVDSPAENGAFNASLQPLSYAVSVDQLPDGAYVKSMTFAGRPVADSTIDLSSGAGGDLAIEIAADGAEVSGKVDRPGAIVQIWPAGGDTVLSVRADARGEFRFHSLPPGDYRVIAWQEIDDDLAHYAPFRAAFEADAVKVHLGERGRERVEPRPVSHEAVAREAAKLK